MRLSINKNSIYKLLIVTIFFDAYCFFNIGARSITIFYVIAFLLFFYSMFDLTNIIKGIKSNAYPLIVLVYFIINFLFWGADSYDSILITEFCWIFYVCSYRKTSIRQFSESVDLFQTIMKFMAVYGLYQIVAYYFNLPFADLSLEGLMVDGYNWGNYISLAGLTLRRSNAIFREPSFFSQFLSINMLIYIQKYIDGALISVHMAKDTLIWLVIDGIALICSFSGTGLLILGFGTIILLISNKANDLLRVFKKYILLVLICIIVLACLVIIPNPLTSYLLSRLAEFQSSNTQSISGYLRMILPFQTAYEVLRYKSFFFGLGIGNAESYITLSGFPVGNSIQSIFARAFVETGFIGGALVVMFFIKSIKRENMKVGSYKALMIGVFLMSFMHGTWSSEVYWLLFGFLNCTLGITKQCKVDIVGAN